MGREIKFRAWDDYNKIMITPYCELRDGAFWGEDTTNNPIHVKHNHVMQFTGLKDKNGKEIYEGDIVQNVADDGRRLSIFEISWQQSSCGFVKEREDGSRFTLEISKHLEVIGNIHEHAHLLV